jgi:hypothetical protein
MDTITKKLHQPSPWTLLYADDVMLAAEKKEDLERDVQKWKDTLDRFGLRLNLKKTEYMPHGIQPIEDLMIDGNPLPISTHFKYLGSTLSSDCESEIDARGRINSAWLKWRQCTGVLCDRKMPIKMKARIYKTVVRPVALYGTECWPTTKKIQDMMHAMEMNMLRWSLGHTRLDKIRNEEIRKSMQVRPIQDKMRENRLRWYGHVHRSSSDSVARSAIDFSVTGKRPKGRPKARWTDTLASDMRAVNLTPSDAQNRSIWRKHSKHADPV